MAQTTVNPYVQVVGAAEIYNSPAGFDQPLVGNGLGDLRTAQHLPERAELVRMGGSYGCQLKEGNAFTILITIPSTLATLSLQNGEAAGGKSYIIDRVWFKTVTTTAAANYLTQLCQVVVPGTTLVADSANKTLTSLSGRSTTNTKSQVAIASTATGCLADKWATIGNTINAATTTGIAISGEALVYGRYIIPPGGNFSVSLQEAVSGGTAIQGIDWHEVQLTLG